jgi:hypothetical protein
MPGNGNARRPLRRGLSDRGFAIGIYLEHLEEASFLYEQRIGLLDDPEVPWPALADFEDRFEAHIDALVLGGELAMDVMRQQAVEGDAGEYHAALRVVCRHQRTDLLRSLLEPLDPADDERIRAAGDALALEMPSAWADLARVMAGASHAGLQQIAARIIGFRRISAGAELLVSLNGAKGARLLASVWALGRLREAAAHPVMWQVFEEQEEVHIRHAAALALARMGDPRILHACVEQGSRCDPLNTIVALSGGWDEFRLLQERAARGGLTPAVVLALGMLGEISAVPVLISALTVDECAGPAATALELITGAGLSGDPDAWRSWWQQNESRFQPFVRYRGGQLWSPVQVVHTMAATNLPRATRELAFHEAAARWGADIPFETDLPVALQRRALVAYMQWAEGAQAAQRAGAWTRTSR